MYQAAAKLKLKSLGTLDSEGKVAKKLVFETFALLMDAAEACILSIWRKLRVCEELFSSFLAVLSKIAVAWKGQPLRVLLIRLKPLVLTVCAQVYTLRIVLDLELRSTQICNRQLSSLDFLTLRFCLFRQIPLAAAVVPCLRPSPRLCVR